MNPEASGVDKSDFKDSKRIKEEPEDIRSAVEVDEQLTVKFEERLKEEPKIESDHSDYFVKISNLNLRLKIELHYQVDLASQCAMLVDNMIEICKEVKLNKPKKFQEYLESEKDSLEQSAQRLKNLLNEVDEFYKSGKFKRPN